MMRRIVLFLALLLVPALAEAACRTVTLPESNNTGGAFTAQPGSNYLVYYPPAGATSVGLEFWSHSFPPGVPETTQYLLVYLNDPGHGGRRIFHAWNSGPEATEYPGYGRLGNGYSVNFPMSTFIHPNEHFVINWLNNLPYPVSGYLITTIRECMP